MLNLGYKKLSITENYQLFLHKKCNEKKQNQNKTLQNKKNQRKQKNPSQNDDESK